MLTECLIYCGKHFLLFIFHPPYFAGDSFVLRYSAKNSYQPEKGDRQNKLRCSGISGFVVIKIGKKSAQIIFQLSGTGNLPALGHIFKLIVYQYIPRAEGSGGDVVKKDLPIPLVKKVGRINIFRPE